MFEQAQALTTLGDLPLVVLTTSESLEEVGGWAAAQDRLAELSTNRVHQDVDSTHSGLVDDEDASAESARAINEVVVAIREGARLTTDN